MAENTIIFQTLKIITLNLIRFINQKIKVLGIHFVDTIIVELKADGTDCYGEKLDSDMEKIFCFDYSKPVYEYAFKQKGVNLVSRYYEIMREAIENLDYSTVAHFDLINKYNQNDDFFIEDDNYKKEVIKTLDLIAEKDLALEVNLGGTVYCNRLVPREWIIKEAIFKRNPHYFRL